MVNIGKIITEALAPLKIPTARLKYSGHEDTYIVFNEYLEMGETFDDDAETLTAHYVQVSVFSKTDFTDLVIKIKQNLINKEFIRESEFETFDSLYFCRVIKFVYYENKQTEV